MKLLFINDVLWRHYVGSFWSAIKASGIAVEGIHLAETHDWIGTFGTLDRQVHQYPHQTLFRGSLQDVGLFQKMLALYLSIRQQHFDILFVYGYNDPAYWLAIFYAKIRQKQVWIYSTSNAFDFHRVWYKEAFKRFLFGFADKAIYCGTTAKDYLTLLGVPARKMAHLPYTIADDHLKKSFVRALPRPAYLPKHCLFYAGRFVKKKNLKALIRAFVGCGCNWGLILLGDGEERENINNYLSDNDIKNVFLFDSVPWHDTPRYLAWAEALILPSVSEPWGLVVNEALTVGFPVLVSKRCGCATDLVKEGQNGYAFDPTEAEIRATIQQFIKNPIQKKRPETIQGYGLRDAVESMKLMINHQSKII